MFLLFFRSEFTAMDSAAALALSSMAKVSSNEFHNEIREFRCTRTGLWNGLTTIGVEITYHYSKWG